MEHNITRRQAVKAVTAGSVVALASSVAASAEAEQDHELVRLDAEWGAAIKAALETSYDADVFAASLPEWIRKGPRLQHGEKYGDEPYYIRTDDDLERILRNMAISLEETEEKVATLSPQHRRNFEAFLRDYSGPKNRKEQQAIHDNLKNEWESAKAAHQAAVEKSGHPALVAKSDVAWERLKEIEELVALTPAKGITGMGVKTRLMEYYLRDFEYAETDITGLIMHSLMRDLEIESIYPIYAEREA